MYIIFAILLTFSFSIEGARTTGVYDPNKAPPGRYHDIYSTRPVESFGVPRSEQRRLKSVSIASEPPRLYDTEGNYRGRWSDDPFDPESIANPTSVYSKVYINPYESLYIIEGEFHSQAYYPTYLHRKVTIIEIESGPFWGD